MPHFGQRSDCLAGHLGMHRAGVDDRPFRHAHVHLGDERERLVGRRVGVGRESLPLLRPLRVLTQDGELLSERRRRRLVAHLDRRQPVRALRRSMLEGQTARLLEERVDDDPLGRREHDRLDELLALDTAAVAADELQPRPRQRDVEDARVGGVREVEANDLALLRGERRFRLAADEQDVAVAAHRRERRLLATERRDLPVLDQDVVERQQQLAVGGRPVVGLGRDDEDVPVLAELLAVVLADVRVVPVDARIRERDAVGEAAADRDRRLRLVGAVVAVLEPQTVPVHRRLEVALVDDVDHELRALADAERRAGHRAVVGDHAHGVAADAAWRRARSAARTCRRRRARRPAAPSPRAGPRSPSGTARTRLVLPWWSMSWCSWCSIVRPLPRRPLIMAPLCSTLPREHKPRWAPVQSTRLLPRTPRRADVRLCRIRRPVRQFLSRRRPAAASARS